MFHRHTNCNSIPNILKYFKKRGIKLNIKDYGFKENLYGNIDIDKIARITATHKDRFEIVCNKGTGFAQIKRGAFYDNSANPYPTTGDFVLIEWNETGDSMIYETLKRQSSFSRTASSSDSKKELHTQHEQLVASNFDYVFIMQSLNNNYNINNKHKKSPIDWEKIYLETNDKIIKNNKEQKMNKSC